METKSNNVVTYFMWYVYNKWSIEESERLFGNMGEHIYEKFLSHGRDGLAWYASLDNDCRQRLVDRAIEIYMGQ